MILDLKEIPEKAMPNFKGGDGMAWVRMFNDERNRILQLRASKLDDIPELAGLAVQRGNQAVQRRNQLIEQLDCGQLAC